MFPSFEMRDPEAGLHKDPSTSAAPVTPTGPPARHFLSVKQTSESIKGVYDKTPMLDDAELWARDVFGCSDEVAGSMQSRVKGDFQYACICRYILCVCVCVKYAINDISCIYVYI